MFADPKAQYCSLAKIAAFTTVGKNSKLLDSLDVPFSLQLDLVKLGTLSSDYPTDTKEQITRSYPDARLVE